MFLTITDFALPPYFIPDSLELEDGTFQDYVDEQEEAELRLLLGDVLYDQFIVGLGSITPDVWWTRLRDGFTYNYGGRTRTWKGLAWLLKPYIWFMWQRDEEVKKTLAGASLAVAENAERVSLSRELCMGYNEYAKRSGFEGCRNQVDSLYGFLKSDTVNYADWEDCSEVEYINSWNI